MKRCFLFSGAAWTVVRFMVLYFSLFSLVSAESGGVFTELLLFSFGSLHAVMTVGYVLAGIYGEHYNAVIKLLAVGQVFAFCADAALVLAFFGQIGGLLPGYGTLPVFPAGLSPLAASVGMAGADALFFFGLIIRWSGGEDGSESSAGQDELPEVHEVSLEEE